MSNLDEIRVITGIDQEILETNKEVLKDYFPNILLKDDESRTRLRNLCENKMQLRWLWAEKLAVILGFRKDYVFNLLKYIDHKGVINGDLEAIRFARDKVQRYYKISSNIREEVMRTPESKVPVKSDKASNVLEKHIEQVKLMLWTIQQIGNAEDAKSAFEAAYKTLKEYEHGRPKES